MRILFLPGLFYLASCNTQPAEKAVPFQRQIPDTTKTWAGQMTKKSYDKAKGLEGKFGLKTLLDGTKNTELRVWNFSGYYDPQVVFILKNDTVNGWQLRTVSFYQTKGDSIYADYTRLIRDSAVDSLGFDRYWVLVSQSDLKAPDSYGCSDGGDVFVELANSSRYRFMWYRCPDMNKNKDSAFLLANELTNRLDGLAIGH
jgi:hypothetical protein